MSIAEWTDTLARNAGTYAQVAMHNVEREFPSDVWHRMRGPDDLPRRPRERLLHDHFTADALQQEAQFIGDPANRGRQRPYGWGWALQLVHYVESWDDADARVWAANFQPLAETLTRNFLEWLPHATYPIRYGVHPNSAFGFSRALPYARTRAGGDQRLLNGLIDKAHADRRVC